MITKNKPFVGCNWVVAFFHGREIPSEKIHGSVIESLIQAAEETVVINLHAVLLKRTVDYDGFN